MIPIFDHEFELRPIKEYDAPLQVLFEHCKKCRKYELWIGVRQVKLPEGYEIVKVEKNE